MSCSQKTKSESGKIEIKKVTLRDIEDDVPLPPEDLTSNFKTLSDWLIGICNNEKPKKSFANYKFGLFESSEDCVIFLVGLNKYDKGDTSYTRIEFEPLNMYFRLPKDEYQNLNRQQLQEKLTSQLKEFINTEKFKASFLAKALTITIGFSGERIWPK